MCARPARVAYVRYKQEPWTRLELWRTPDRGPGRYRWYERQGDDLASTGVTGFDVADALVQAEAAWGRAGWNIRFGRPA